MKYIAILLLCALPLTACGGDEPADTECEFNESLCPTCEVCEECEECTVLECPEAECELEGSYVELHLDDVELLKSERGKDEDITVVKLVDEEFDTMETATLRFLADCVDPGTLVIKLEGDEVYEREPPCNEPVEKNLELALFDYGRSTFTFTTLGDEDYKLEDIELYLTFLNGSNTTKDLFSISFTPSDADRETVRTLTDVRIQNYEEYEVSLTSEQAEDDLILAFDSQDREGLLVVLVNEEEVYSGEVQRHVNEITIPHQHLDKGENHITFIGVSG